MANDVRPTPSSLMMQAGKFFRLALGIIAGTLILGAINTILLIALITSE
jgi:hypothetical protein